MHTYVHTYMCAYVYTHMILTLVLRDFHIHRPYMQRIRIVYVTYMQRIRIVYAPYMQRIRIVSVTHMQRIRIVYADCPHLGLEGFPYPPAQAELSDKGRVQQRLLVQRRRNVRHRRLEVHLYM